MQQYARLIGVDVGKKRFGLAQTDLLKTIASPVGTFSADEIIPAIKEIAEQDSIEKIVVGWPLTPKGDEGQATIMVAKFIKRLKKAFPGLDIVKIDERYTSNQAMEKMIEAGVPRKKRRQKERVDRIAAALILQKYLDQHT